MLVKTFANGCSRLSERFGMEFFANPGSGFFCNLANGWVRETKRAIEEPNYTPELRGVTSTRRLVLAGFAAREERTDR